MLAREAETADIDRLAIIWYDGWRDAHAGILPEALAKHRTLDGFAKRLVSLLPEVRIIDLDGKAVGFAITQKNELYQLYVAAEARGTGVATTLLADAEERIAASGAGGAWLACAIGNHRAARFYQRNGWAEAGTIISELPTSDGVFPLEVWRYEKRFDERVRPEVGVGHVVMETDRMTESCRFMQLIGMRPIHESDSISVYEMRGATHLILMRKDRVTGHEARFDLMVDDIRETHGRFIALGLGPTPIEARPEIDHHTFNVREPAGHDITFYSSHASGKPV